MRAGVPGGGQHSILVQGVAAVSSSRAGKMRPSSSTVRSKGRIVAWESGTHDASGRSTSSRTLSPILNVCNGIIERTGVAGGGVSYVQNVQGSKTKGTNVATAGLF